MSQFNHNFDVVYNFDAIYNK